MTAPKNTDALVTELLTLLGEEAGLYQDLIAAGRAKRDALVAVDLAQVETATQREEDLLRTVGRTALRRGETLREIGAVLRLGSGEPKLEEVLPRVGEPRAAQIAGLRADIRRALEELKRLNGLNQALTRQSLAHVQDFLRLLTRGGGPGPLYTRRGLEERPVRSHLVIDRTA